MISPAPGAFPFIKVCGLTEDVGLDAALDAGADALGFVFYDRSPRNIAPEVVAELTQLLDDVLKVGVFVDPDDALLARVLSTTRLDLVQLHGLETPERVNQVRQEFAVPVMKAIAVAQVDDVLRAQDYFAVADALLFDAKAPVGADRPGGNALAFDWSLMQGLHCPLPWMLAGGLNPENIAVALRDSGAVAVDVSSGVESAPGVKDPEKVAAFVRNATAFFAG